MPTVIVEWFRKTGLKALLALLFSCSIAAVLFAFLQGESHPFFYLPGGLAVGSIVWTVFFFHEIDRQDQADFFRRSFTYLPSIVGLISLPLWIWVSFAILPTVERPVFEVAAQIIPVLLLALIIDVRQSNRLETSDLSLTIILLLMGEAVAIYYAAGANDMRLAFSAVAYVLVIGFAAIVFAIAADYEEYDPKEKAASYSSTDLQVVAAALTNLAEIAQRAEPKEAHSTAAYFILKNDSNGSFYFNLAATNGQVIASSESYETKASALKGIESVKRNAPTAEIDDQTDK